MRTFAVGLCLWMVSGGLALPQDPANPTPNVTIITSTATGMKLALIPAGTFQMGSSEADVRAVMKADPTMKEVHLQPELPQHTVRISKPFYMGVYEVTQDEYKQVMGTNPSSFSATGMMNRSVSGQETSNFPVEHVSWFDAIEFCNKLSAKENLPIHYKLTKVKRSSKSSKSKSAAIDSVTVSVLPGGKGYRLPSEAEWEYACRADTKTPFDFGSILNGDKANVLGIFPYGTTTKGTHLERTTMVGSYASNAFGLYDMHGNVSEWCFDVFDKAVYKGRSGTTIDPLTTTGAGSRVLRGGDCFDPAGHARSALRKGLPPDQIPNGFRVVRTE